MSQPVTVTRVFGSQMLQIEMFGWWAVRLSRSVTGGDVFRSLLLQIEIGVWEGFLCLDL